MKKRKLNKKRFILFVLVMICLLSSFSFGIYSFAKYISQNEEKSLVIPANVEFSSNYLKENNPSYNIYDWEDGLEIELYNFVNINKSEIDIPYTVSVTNATSNVSSGTITTSENADTIIVNSPVNINNPVIVSVSSNIYNYTLSATFNFVNTGDKSYYSFTDKGEYCELDINTSSNDIDSLIINWNANYSPDNTNSLMENWSGTTGSLSLSRSTKYTFIFFKNTNILSPNITNSIIQNNTVTLP